MFISRNLKKFFLIVKLEVIPHRMLLRCKKIIDDFKTNISTLGVLIQDGVIEAGDGVMAVDYLGQTFKGDLLTNGKIKSHETNLVFNNPSAWAIYCKKIVNPSKKSGCGESKEF